MGWNETGKFGIHSGKTLRRYPTRKNGDSKSQSRNEFAVVKELRCGKKVKNVDTAKLGLEFEDGGLPLEKHSLVYSLNKHKRWLLPEMLKENVNEMFHEENDNEKTDLGKKKKTKKPKKGGKEKADSKLHVSVVERHCSTSGKSWWYRPDCVGVTSNAPLNPLEPERKPKKKYAHVGDLKSKVDDEEMEIYYEFLAPHPKKVWLNNRYITCHERDSFMGAEQRPKLKKKDKGKRKKGHGRSTNQNLEEVDDFGLLDDSNHNVSEEYNLEPLNSQLAFPTGASIQEVIEAKTAEASSEVILETNESVLASPTSTVYGKGQAVYVDNNSELQKDSNLNETGANNDGQAVSKFETPSKDETFKINLLTEDIACDSLSNKFGMNYIEGEVSPRKFIIKLDLNELIPNDDICILFELPNNPSVKDTVEANVSLSLPKTGLIQTDLNSELQSELNRLQNDETLTVEAITDCLMEKIISHLKTESKSIMTKKSASNIPTEFIKQLSKQKSMVCGFKKATEFALGCQERSDEGCLVTLENGNIEENGKLFCEICYVEDDMESNIEKSGFTQLLKCSHNFCNSCLSLYIASKITAGQSSITCPYFNCKTTIDEPLVWSCTNSTFYQKYRKLSIQNLISTNPQLQYCPTADCPHLAYIDGLDIKQPNSVPVLCKCGLVWCFSCQKPAHWPASCKEMDIFLKDFKDHEEYMKKLRYPGSISSVQVKKCPFCHAPIEKSFGCSFMTCRNEHYFCWDCLQPYFGHKWYLCEDTRNEELELAVTHGSARYEKYCKMAVRNGLERCGKKFAAFKQSTEKAKRVENAHKLVTHNPKTSTCKFVQRYVEKNVASVVDDLFRFKNRAHFVLENTAVYVAITRATKLVKPLDRNMEILNFVVQRCSEVLLEPSLLLKEGRLETIQELLKQGQELIWNIDRLIKANRKE